MNFDEIRHNPYMRDYVTSQYFPNQAVPQKSQPQVFPNTGASMLSREIDVIRGELNKQTNKLIEAGQAPPPTNNKENPLLFKSDFHKQIYDIGSDVFDGRRISLAHPDGSITISKKINDHIHYQYNDGVGDFSKTPFNLTKKNLESPYRLGTSNSGNLQIPNLQPKTTVYIPTGDNIDVNASEFNSTVESSVVAEPDPETNDQLPETNDQLPETNDQLPEPEPETNDQLPEPEPIGNEKINQIELDKKPDSTSIKSESTIIDPPIEANNDLILKLDGVDYNLTTMISKDLKKLAKDNNISLKGLTKNEQFATAIYSYFNAGNIIDKAERYGIQTQHKDMKDIINDVTNYENYLAKLRNMKREDLQKLAKKKNFNANQKNEMIIANLMNFKDF